MNNEFIEDKHVGVLLRVSSGTLRVVRAPSEPEGGCHISQTAFNTAKSGSLTCRLVNEKLNSWSPAVFSNWILVYILIPWREYQSGVTAQTHSAYYLEIQSVLKIILRIRIYVTVIPWREYQSSVTAQTHRVVRAPSDPEGGCHISQTAFNTAKSGSLICRLVNGTLNS
ncbi:hypothetical protein C8R44DRAFT_747430 [Mycena epipterygia]|nr:hypothetical protein C8R44DRAFT_747430 [Mycena epipterygia]